MRPSVFQMRAVVVALAGAIACMSANVASAASAVSKKLPTQISSPCNRVEMGPTVRLAVGKSSLVRPSSPVVRLLLGNPQHTQAARPSEENAKPEDEKTTRQTQDNRAGAADLDVLLLSPSEIYLLGKSIGTTNIVLLDRAGQCTMLDVVVGMDTSALSASLKEFLPAESGIKISSAADSLVISGTVSDSSSADRVIDLANAYVRSGAGATAKTSGNPRIINLLEVGAPQQVMLEVKVAEISKSMLDQFGLNYSRAFAGGDGIRFISGLIGGKGLLGGSLAGAANGTVGLGLVGSLTNGRYTLGNTVPAGSASVGGETTTIPIATGTNSTVVSSDAQKEDGLVKILAEPNVMAISGQEGSFLAGGKIFIPVTSNNGMGGSSITLEEREFGVSLKFTPTVLTGDRINLKVSPEVSELSSTGVTITSTTAAGSSILPSFTTRRASTTVQLKDGQSFAIGGLIKNNVTSNITAFPFLGELPVIGSLFRSTSFQNDRSELVFVITPHLVKPLPSDYPLPTDAYAEPSRYDMIMDGKLEGSPKDVPPARTSAPADAGTARQGAAPDGFEVK